MLIGYFLRRPIAVSLSFLIIIGAGLLTLNRIPISLLPDVEIPKIQVVLNYDNASAKQIEGQIVKHLRNQFLQVNHVQDVWSTSSDGFAILELFFDYGIDMSLSYIEVNEKLDQITSLLPSDLERPQVILNGLGDLPVLYISVTPPQDRNESYYLELSQFSENVIKRRLEQLAEVSLVDRTGYFEPRILAIPNFDKLASLGIELDQLKEFIRRNNLTLDNLMLKDGHYVYQVQFLSDISSLEDLKTLDYPHQSQQIPLKELLRLEYDILPNRGLYFVNGEKAILFAIRKQAKARLLRMNNEIRATISDLENQYPELKFSLHRDQSNLISVSMSNLLSSLGFGCLFAIVVLFVAYRSYSTVFLIGFVIPSTILASLVFFYISGLSINIISLSGLILGVGLMIDNSIIIIDNIQRHRSEGNNIVDSCILAIREVFSPLLSSMLTTCSVFLPLLLLNGTSGALFYDQAIAVFICLLVSLILASVLIPVLTVILGLSTNNSKYKLNKELSKWHTRILDVVDRRSHMILLFYCCFVIFGFYQFLKIEKSAFPSISREGLECHINWNEPIDHKQQKQRLKAWNKVEQDELYTDSEVLIGDSQFRLDASSNNQQEAKLYLYQQDEKERRKLKRTLSAYLDKYVKADYTINPIRNAFDEIFNSTSNELFLLLKPYNFNDKNKTWDKMLQRIDSLKTEGVLIDYPSQKTIMQIGLKKNLIMAYGIEEKRIKDKIRFLLGQYSLGKIELNSQTLLIQVSPPTQDFIKSLRSSRIKINGDTSVPIQPLIELDYIVSPDRYQATQLGESWRLRIHNPSSRIVETIYEASGQDQEFEYRLVGSWIENSKQLNSLIAILIISLILLFFILSIQFESLRLPLVVMLTLPFGIAGSFVGLWLGGQSINLVSLIGVVVMSGIMVNDAILKVDMIRKFERKGVKREKALHLASQRRVQAIILTSLTTILALLPILFGSGLGADLQRPMAIAVIGGIFVGTISSLTLLPILYKLVAPKTNSF